MNVSIEPVPEFTPHALELLVAVPDDVLDAATMTCAARSCVDAVEVDADGEATEAEAVAVLVAVDAEDVVVAGLLEVVAELCCADGVWLALAVEDEVDVVTADCACATWVVAGMRAMASVTTDAASAVSRPLPHVLPAAMPDSTKWALCGRPGAKRRPRREG